MTSKIEARRFSGKPGTWSHYAMAVKAHIAIDELTDYFNDGTTVAAAAIVAAAADQEGRRQEGRQEGRLQGQALRRRRIRPR